MSLPSPSTLGPTSSSLDLELIPQKKAKSAREALITYAQNWRSYSGLIPRKSREKDPLTEIDQVFAKIVLVSQNQLGIARDEVYIQRAIKQNAEEICNLALSLFSCVEALKIPYGKEYFLSACNEARGFLHATQSLSYQDYVDVDSIQNPKKLGAITKNKIFALNIDCNVLANTWKKESTKGVPWWDPRPACFKRLDSILNELMLAASVLAQNSIEDGCSQETKTTAQNKFDVLIARFDAELILIYSTTYQALSPARKEIINDFFKVAKIFLKATGESDKIWLIEKGFIIPSVSSANEKEYRSNINEAVARCIAQAAAPSSAQADALMPKLKLARGIPPLKPNTLPVSLSATSAATLGNSIVSGSDDGLDLPLIQACLATWRDDLSRRDELSSVIDVSQGIRIPDPFRAEIETRIDFILQIPKGVLAKGELTGILQLLLEKTIYVLYYYQDNLSSARRAALRNLVLMIAPTYKDVDMLERMSWVVPLSLSIEVKHGELRRVIIRRIADHFLATMNWVFFDFVQVDFELLGGVDLPIVGKLIEFKKSFQVSDEEIVRDRFVIPKTLLRFLNEFSERNLNFVGHAYPDLAGYIFNLRGKLLKVIEECLLHMSNKDRRIFYEMSEFKEQKNMFSENGKLVQGLDICNRVSFFSQVITAQPSQSLSAGTNEDKTRALGQSSGFTPP